MALTQVRAKLGDTWTVLTYNEATGRYEGTLTPPGTSIHQPGGYYNIQVEASDQSGETASISGTQLPSLRLVVRETAAPALTLVSPAPGYLKTGTPVFVFEAVDEEGGSGVDPGTFSLEGAAAEAITGGYRFTWSPPGGWADGGHTITASVADYDGNVSTVSGAYTVDTVPPELILLKPFLRHVTDAGSVLVSGEAWDITAPNITVTVAGNAVPVVSGGFEAEVPLAVGENHIQVVATDGAGNQTTGEVYMIRLVTDRTREDVSKLGTLMARPVSQWSQEELEWFNTAPCLRGSYNVEDWNRVGLAVQLLAGELARRGYAPSVQPKTDWARTDAPTRGQMDTYLKNAAAVRDAQPVERVQSLPLPASMRHTAVEDWNHIEQALVEADKLFPRYSAWTSGEATCGEV